MNKEKNRFRLAKEKRDKETLALAEKHIISPSNKYFNMLKDFCKLSKNLYNHANFLVRQEFMNNNNWLRSQDLDKILRADTKYPDYKNMPMAQSAQQILKVLDTNWSSFFKAIKSWKVNKSKFNGRPKQPKYLNKDGYFELILTNQNVKLQNNTISFPKVFNGFSINPYFLNNENTKNGKLQQVIIHFDGVNIVIEVIYRIQKPKIKENNNRIMGIDVGVINMLTCATNTGDLPIIFSGGPAKSINQYYNKEKAKLHSCAGKRNKQKSTKRIKKLTKKRNHKMNDYIHKVSRKVIDYCEEHDITTIIIGKNKQWKVSPPFSKTENQNFVSIPLAVIIDKIVYKAKMKGITVFTHEESYTSGTSFLDNEKPTKKFYNKNRRKKRGLFISNTGIKINADVNAALQIIKKQIPKAIFSDNIKKAILNPIIQKVA